MSSNLLPDNGSDERDASDGGSPDWSQFSQRLASFGLGETKDPLTTQSPPAGAPPARRHGDGDPIRRP